MVSKPGVDIIVHGSRGDLVAAVEVKNLRDLDAKAADEIRDRYRAGGLLPNAPYFLLVSQTRGFLWSAAAPDRPEEFPMDSIVRSYGGAVASEHWLRGGELELVIAAWLGDLAWGNGRESLDGAAAALTRSGFLDAIQGGRVSAEAAA
jgi:hypothetical protein